MSVPASYTCDDESQFDMTKAFMNMKHYQQKQTLADLQGAYPPSSLAVLKHNQMLEAQNRYYSPYLPAYDPDEQKNLNQYSPFITTTNVNPAAYYKEKADMWNTQAQFPVAKNVGKYPPNYDASYKIPLESIQISLPKSVNPYFQTNTVASERINRVEMFQSGGNFNPAVESAKFIESSGSEPIVPASPSSETPPPFPEGVGYVVPVLLSQIYNSEARILGTKVNNGYGVVGHYDNTLHPAYVNMSMSLQAPQDTPIFR